jgi:hypothetical protein
MKAANYDKSSPKRWIASGIIVLLIGLALNLYAVSGFPFSPALDWYVNFLLGAVVFLVGVGMLDRGLGELNAQRQNSE